MKKPILLITISIIFSLLSIKAYCNNNLQTFINHFSTCSGWVNNDERRVSVILGWSDRRCYYKEISHKEEITCGFKQLELEEMINIMKKENFDYTKGLNSLQGAKKFLYLSPDVCTVNTNAMHR